MDDCLTRSSARRTDHAVRPLPNASDSATTTHCWKRTIHVRSPWSDDDIFMEVVEPIELYQEVAQSLSRPCNSRAVVGECPRNAQDGIWAESINNFSQCGFQIGCKSATSSRPTLSRTKPSAMPLARRVLGCLNRVRHGGTLRVLAFDLQPRLTAKRNSLVCGRIVSSCRDRHSSQTKGSSRTRLKFATLPIMAGGVADRDSKPA